MSIWTRTKTVPTLQTARASNLLPDMLPCTKTLSTFFNQGSSSSSHITTRWDENERNEKKSIFLWFSSCSNAFITIWWWCYCCCCCCRCCCEKKVFDRNGRSAHDSKQYAPSLIPFSYNILHYNFLDEIPPSQTYIFMIFELRTHCIWNEFNEQISSRW